MNIAILYICTGDYDVFWEKFYNSAEKNLLPGIQKNYFVFTDSKKITPTGKVHIIYQKKLKWPYPTLLRFKMFVSISNKLQNYDFIFFMNANLEIIEKIGEEILPYKEGLCVVLHPGYFALKELNEMPYERNPDSSAYIPFGYGKYYFMGGFNGGRSKEYLSMCEELNNNIIRDLSRGIIAVWHDESHLNHYMLNRIPKILDSRYGYPEGVALPFSQKIIIRDKNNYGGHNKLRGIKDKQRGKVGIIFRKMLHYLRGILNTIFAYIGRN